MAPVTLKKFFNALQRARESEIDGIRERLISKPRASITKGIVQSRLEALGAVWSEVRKTHSEIIVRDDAGSDAYVVDDWFKRIQGVYENAVDECLTLLPQFEMVAGSRMSGADSASVSDMGTPSVAKLPRIPLPTFSGKYEDWDSFCDLFTTLVLDAPRLADATKLQYLKSCLTGSAAELIKDVASTSANYAST
ncbi:PREDICTED: uncharacterized protein LOC108776670 [Cyphomyrmex costatus]|uniref:uncharacterized protein LOC108776670 n=1 Tax=Cyphomyrmex costatus TaxID=456900 RepID=UPI0008521DF9|nr:PREDICTED: uncharacterized protein LOC108776670 [Cyphomyrmex costatus]